MTYNIKLGRNIDMHDLVYYYMVGGIGYRCPKGIPREMLYYSDTHIGEIVVIDKDQYEGMDIKKQIDWD